MEYKDLQEYISSLDSAKDLKIIEAKVDPVLEITEIADRIIKSGWPALLFSNVKGSPYPLAINLFGTYERTCSAFGVNSPDEIVERIKTFIPDTMPSSITDKAKLLWQMKDLKNFQPKTVRSGISQEVVESDANLFDLPVLKCWPKDAGRFITLPVSGFFVITRGRVMNLPASLGQHFSTGRSNRLASDSMTSCDIPERTVLG